MSSNTTVPSPGSVATLAFLSVLPVIFIVTCSILLDYVLRFEATTIRCQCQVWMWLAVAMSWMQETFTSLDPESDGTAFSVTLEAVFHVWAHTTICINVIAIVIERGQYWMPLSKVGTYPDLRHTTLPSGKMPIKVQVLKILSLSSWMTLLFAAFQFCTMVQEEKLRHGSLSIKFFGITTVVLIIAMWHVQRQKKILDELKGNPVVRSVPYNDEASEGELNRFCGPEPRCFGVGSTTAIPLPDETQWYKWNRTQTLQWLSQQLAKMDRESNASFLFTDAASVDERTEAKDMILTKFASHDISGDILDELADVSKLLLLNIPFGPACRLSRSIASLTKQFRNPNNSAMFSNATLPNGESVLEQHDKEYNSSLSEKAMVGFGGMRIIDSADTSLRKLREMSSLEGRLDENAATPHVPTENFKGDSHLPKSYSDLTHASFNRTNETLPSDRQTASTRNNNLDSTSSEEKIDTKPSFAVPTELLDHMPPHIQEIARRRPELVKKLLLQKQQGLVQSIHPMGVSGSNGHTRLPRESALGSTMGIKSFPPHSSDLSNIRENEYDDQETDFSDDDETTGLIQHEKISETPSQYRSIDKTTS
ncbi:hypothetical protein IV203_003723 [Nitzschia inconspicua]|uniref:Uncharacterized protein n=1 Tax=Nitzschia inconspicua TaxID=303405 RepID=A0A9K3L2V0_9STRA|nr:hypothetical protein IV203_003723 [Nitzschia inconspicua]